MPEIYSDRSLDYDYGNHAQGILMFMDCDILSGKEDHRTPTLHVRFTEKSCKEIVNVEDRESSSEGIGLYHHGYGYPQG